ncbi:MAG: dihydrolipoamide acetyltransferase family protein [Thermaerobacter sp.]|nr:dihydrolipoamide acetyltransferase family protein [Thermaerobacter sp.]
MPQLGESVTEGTIGRWLKQVGDQVEKYEPIVEVATDKVNAEVPSPFSGVLTEIIAAEGETLSVGQPICEIAEQGGDSAEAPAAAKVPDAPTPKAPAAGAMDTADAPQPVPAAYEPLGAAQNAGRVRTSPYVRRLANDAGIDLQLVPASGAEGRVTREDLARFQQQAPASAAAAAPAQPAAAAPQIPQPAPPVQPPAMAGDRFMDLTPMRRTIAEHMVRSKREAPHATAWFEVDMSSVVALRKRIRAEFEEREGVPLTYLPFVTKAAVEALREFPQINASWGGDKIIVHGPVHVGLAVAIPDGLIVPILRNADGLSIAGIARGANDLITRARAGRLTLTDIEGGTFTVNNPGSYGSVFSAPVINQPQAAILSMEAIVKRPVVVQGDAIAVRSMMFLSFSFDHRVLDGAMANQYLASVKRRLEAMGPETAVY